jgi:hypothetical protein
MNTTETGAGYDAWERGLPFDKFQSQDWQDGWMTAHHRDFWDRLGQQLGARLTGFTFDYRASFLFEDGSHYQIEGAVVEQFKRLTGVYPRPIKE